MSRVSIRSFLAQAKRALSQVVDNKNKHALSFVIGNESADLDSITCALVYGYLQSSTATARKTKRCIIPVANLPASELRLRPELTALLKHADLKPSDLVTLDDLGDIWNVLPYAKIEWTLVDLNVLPGPLRQHYASHVTGVIDHHEDERNIPLEVQPRIIEKTGSCNSLVVNYCYDVWESISAAATAEGASHDQDENATYGAEQTSLWDAQLAKLALGSILIDTANLKDQNKTTDRDRKAVQYLETKVHASVLARPKYDRDAFFEEINTAKSDLDDLSLDAILRKDYKQWREGDLNLGISSVVKPIQYLHSKESNLVPTLVNFARSRKLQLFAVMIAHTDSDRFQRQLLLIAIEGEKAVEAMNKFIDNHAKGLQLADGDAELDCSAAERMQVWQQENVAASRKQVAPLLREAMK